MREGGRESKREIKRVRGKREGGRGEGITLMEYRIQKRKSDG